MRLFLTYCSRKKRNAILPPDKLYVSPRIDKFTQYCKNKALNWAIISAKYGFFFPEESKEPYNVTFRNDRECWLGIQIVENSVKISKEDSCSKLKGLVSKIKAQAIEHSVDKLAFYTWSLMQPKCYLSLMHFLFDSCERYHSWQELLKCIERNWHIKVITKLNLC